MTAQNLPQAPLPYNEQPQYGYNMLQLALNYLNSIHTILDKLKELITEAAGTLGDTLSQYDALYRQGEYDIQLLLDSAAYDNISLFNHELPLTIEKTTFSITLPAFPATITHIHQDVDMDAKADDNHDKHTIMPSAGQENVGKLCSVVGGAAWTGSDIEGNLLNTSYEPMTSKQNQEFASQYITTFSNAVEVAINDIQQQMDSFDLGLIGQIEVLGL